MGDMKTSCADATSVQQLAILHQLQFLRTIQTTSKMASRSPSMNGSSSAGEVANAAGSLRDSLDWGPRPDDLSDSRAHLSPSREGQELTALQVTPKNGMRRGRRTGLRPLSIDITAEEGADVSPTGGRSDQEEFVFTSSPGLRRAPGEESESEGRAVFAAGNFDLGGFTISNTGLVSSPRNRAKQRPSLNDGNNFIVLSRLGCGNSGTVHKALHFPTMRLVALKALPLYDAERRGQMMRELKTLYLNLANIHCSPSTRSRVPSTASSCCSSPTPALSAAEAAATSSLEGRGVNGTGDDPLQVSMGMAGGPGGEEETYCPYMVSFYDAFADSKHGCLNLVVDYMDGGSLQDIVDRGGCPNEEVLACISYQVLMGLNFLHQRKKIHRDIKPSNLLINSMGYVRIADFGVSRSLEDCTDIADTFIGTLAFMDPQRITGQEYSYEADIWGFGLSIMACALGRFPLNTLSGGGGYWGLVHAVCDNPAPELPDGASQCFRDFIRRCFVKDPTQRASARELLKHPFLTSRPELSDPDHYSRLADCPEVHHIKEAELDQICRAMRAHFQGRRCRNRNVGSGGEVDGTTLMTSEVEGQVTQAGGLDGSTSSTTPSLPASRERSPQDRLSVMLSRVFPGRLRMAVAHGNPVLTTDMIQRLSEELGLEEALVTDRLKASLGDVVELRKTPKSTAVR